jgi:NTE family protein
VAIACQGGGSPHRLTAGVLKRLLGAEELAGYEVVGLSGTSGGAVCALLAWSALRAGDPAAAGGLLEDFWPTTRPPPAGAAGQCLGGVGG